jgi:ACS family hexuronate transporter-like MFS transporter
MPEENPIADARIGGRTEVSSGPVEYAARVGALAGRFHWVICGLLFLGVTKNYMDRRVLGVLKGPLQHEFGWNEIDYGNLVFAFQAAYALGMILVGRLTDCLGTRIGYALAMVFWSLASMGHAIAHSLTTFVIARSALGFGEAGVSPASIKCVAEWFPKKERALATGIFNAGTNIGTIITPLIVPCIAVYLGRQSVVGIGGMLGAIGGMLIAETVGHVLQWTSSYMIPFFIAASAYPIALLLIHTLNPRLEPVVIGQG